MPARSEGWKRSLSPQPGGEASLAPVMAAGGDDVLHLVGAAGGTRGNSDSSRPGLGPAVWTRGQRPLPAPHLAPAGATGPGPDAAPASASQDGGGCGSTSGAPACRKGWAGPRASALVGPQADEAPGRLRGGRERRCGPGWAGSGELRPRSHLGGGALLLFVVYHLCPGRTSRAVRVPRCHVGGERGGRPGGSRWDCSRRCWF